MTTYFISPTGNDTTGNGTQISPWLNLFKAEGVALPGDTIFCRGGNYGAQSVIWEASGTVGNVITVDAFENEIPIFSAPLSPNLNFITLDKASYATFRRLEVTGYKNMIHTDGCPRDGDLAVCGGVDIPATNIIIEENNIHDTISHAIYISGTSEDVIIRNNILRDPGQPEGQFGIQHCIQLWHGRPAKRVDIYNNICIGGNHGIILAKDWPPDVQENVNIFNNLFYENNMSGVSIWGTVPPIGHKVKNNIFVNSINGAQCIAAPFASTGQLAGITFDHNLYHKTGTGNFAELTDVNYTTFNAWKAGTGQDTNSLEGDPLFVNQALEDFHLQAGSPAIDMGVAT